MMLFLQRSHFTISFNPSNNPLTHPSSQQRLLQTIETSSTDARSCSLLLPEEVLSKLVSDTMLGNENIMEKSALLDIIKQLNKIK